MKKRTWLMEAIVCGAYLLTFSDVAGAIPLPDSSSCSTSSGNGCLKITNTNSTGNSIGIYGDGQVIGVRGFSANGMGIQGVSTGYLGIYGSSTSSHGVSGLLRQ